MVRRMVITLAFLRSGPRGSWVHRSRSASCPMRPTSAQLGSSTVVSGCGWSSLYSEDELRELADGAGIQHGRITKMQTLRERLAQHFAELLPERDDA